mgnify:FL=1
MKRLLTAFAYILLTAVSFLWTPWALSASEEESQANPEKMERPQQRSARGAREGYRMGRRMGARQERVRALMKRLDSDGDRRISLEEFRPPEQNQFSDMDGNGDGELTQKEMQKFQTRKLKERIEKQFASLDRNGDKRVTAEEMQMDRFANMDKDGDGYLTPPELMDPRRRGPAPHPE